MEEEHERGLFKDQNIVDVEFWKNNETDEITSLILHLDNGTIISIEPEGNGLTISTESVLDTIEELLEDD